MSNEINSRREFLSHSAKLATAAGLATAAVAHAMGPGKAFDRGPKVSATAGPNSNV